MLLLDNYQLSEGQGQGYVIGLFLPLETEPHIIREVMNAYLKTLPRQAYFQHIIPSSCSICITVGHPFNIPDHDQPDIARAIISTWFHHLDTLNIKGSAAVTFGEILFKRFPNYDHFTGRCIYTAFKAFEAACTTLTIPNIDTHIMGACPSAMHRMQIGQLRHTYQDPKHTWAEIHVDAFHASLIALTKPSPSR